VAPSRIDLLARIAGVPEFGKAWERRVQATFGEVAASYLSLDDLIEAKASAGRDQDRADLRSLRRVRRRT